MIGAGPFVLILIVLAVFTFWIDRRFAVRANDVAWVAAPATPTADTAVVYRRYLKRHRRHRLAGGLFGFALAIVVGSRLYGEVTIGISDGNPLADVWFCILGGVVFGALSAETYRLQERSNRHVAASLGERRADVDPRLTQPSRMLTAGTVVVGITFATLGEGFDALGVALAGAVLFGVAQRTRRAILERRRPLLSTDARAVDEQIRAFAARSVAWLQVATAFLAAGWVLAKLPTVDQSEVRAIRVMAICGCLTASVFAVKRASPYPPADWAPESATVAAP